MLPVTVISFSSLCLPSPAGKNGVGKPWEELDLTRSR